MLGSLSSSASHDGEDQEEPAAATTDAARPLHYYQQPPSQMRQHLLSCAELVAHSDFSSARQLLSVLSSASSPCGDSTERLLHYFSRALFLRINPPPTDHNGADADQSLQSCYLSLNQITPFMRFSHLTANQAILEATQVGHHHQPIHIIDFDIMHGVQWPPLMQALAERAATASQPPPMLRITGTGRDLTTLHRTGERLLKFANSLGLSFQFHPLLVLDDDPSAVALHLPPALTILPEEILAVNCVLYLHRLLKDDSRDLRLFLQHIKALSPAVVTVAEREANHNQPIFVQRFAEALDYYAAIFDSLEATLPPSSKERLAVEQMWLGREIADVVAAEGEARRERHQRLERWEVILRSSGFCNVPLSQFALSQAKLLLRLHYPSEGYHLHNHTKSFFLCWQNKPLFSLSSWH